MSLAGRSCQRDRSGRPAVTVAMRRRERKEHCDEGGEREERERERVGFIGTRPFSTRLNIYGTVGSSEYVDCHRARDTTRES